MLKEIRDRLKKIAAVGRKICRDWGKTWITVTVFAVALNSGTMFLHRIALQRGIAEAVLRFHVLANSDSDADQEVKYLVRDTVLQWMQRELQKQESMESGRKADGKSAEKADAPSKEQTEEFLETHLAELTQVANDALLEEGVSYTAGASLETCYFPDRTYGDCTFPAGWYEALRIQLGEAKGHNWWCVLYPKLCFSDCIHAVIEEEEQEELRDVLTAEEYESLFRQPEKWKISFRWF